MLLSKNSSLIILIGEDVLLSTPESKTSSLSNPFIFLPKFVIPSFIELFILSLNISFKFANWYFPFKIGFTLSNLVVTIPSL